MSADQNFQCVVVFELDGTPIGVFASEEGAKDFIATTGGINGPYLAYKETPMMEDLHEPA